MTPNAQKQELRTTRTSTTTGTTSTSTSSMSNGPGCVSKEDLEIIRDCYVDNIGKMTAPVARMIEGKLAAGMQPAVICHAIEETGFAPRPSAYYLRAILSRFHSSDIYTLEDLQQDRARREFVQSEAQAERWTNWYG